VECRGESREEGGGRHVVSEGTHLAGTLNWRTNLLTPTARPGPPTTSSGISASYFVPYRVGLQVIILSECVGFTRR
jgi:hypothetical protein